MAVVGLQDVEEGEAHHEVAAGGEVAVALGTAGVEEVDVELRVVVIVVGEAEEEEMFVVEEAEPKAQGVEQKL